MRLIFVASGASRWIPVASQARTPTRWREATDWLLCFDGNAGDGVALTDGVNNIHVFGTPEYGVDAIKMRRRYVRDEELATARVLASVSHRQCTRCMLLRVDLAVNLVPRTTGSGAIGATALNHEVADDAMKGQAIIVNLFHEVGEILNGPGGILLEKLKIDRSFVRYHDWF